MTKTNLRLRVCLAVQFVLVAGIGCGAAKDGGEAQPPPLRTGSIRATVQSPGPVADVDAVAFVAVPDNAACDATPLASTVSKPEEETLPPGLLPPGGGSMHRFADGLFVLAAGRYKVCATPLTSEGKPSLKCGRAEGEAVVMPEATTEIVLTSQCEGAPSGGLDAVVVLNLPPQIDTLDIKKSKFITTCEKAEIAVGARESEC